MRISNQRLRNLTTGILHTKMSDIYEDLDAITGMKLMTHELPSARDAALPWLKKAVPDPAFWDGEYRPDHTGEVEITDPSKEEQAAMLEALSPHGGFVLGAIPDRDGKSYSFHS